MFFLKTFLKYFKHFVKVLTETSHTNIRGEQLTLKALGLSCFLSVLRTTSGTTAVGGSI